MDTATLANEFKLVFVEAVFVVCGAVCSPDVNLYIPFMSEFSQRNYWFLFYLRVSFPNTFSDILISGWGFWQISGGDDGENKQNASGGWWLVLLFVVKQNKSNSAICVIRKHRYICYLERIAWLSLLWECPGQDRQQKTKTKPVSVGWRVKYKNRHNL